MRQIICALLSLMLFGCMSHMSLREKNANLWRYVATGDSVKVKEMLDSGADINSATKHGDTPLHLAIKYEHLDTATLLINRGANINAPGALDDSPLHASIYMKQKEFSGLLIEKGANENLLNRYGLRPHEMEGVPEIEKKVFETAELMNKGGNWIDRNRARVLYNHLKDLEDKYVTNALVLQVIKKSIMRRRILILAIKLGTIGSEGKLASLLMVYGDKSMAEDYLNCGSSLLAAAARKWASANGYEITTGFGSNRSTWGRF
ncbi:MAG: ankyrin repeat domain-containing protein [Planctomycetes bacterium]|nr:ankyrin repeat domain-containing protein [Planctomycetota bacterium]